MVECACKGVRVCNACEDIKPVSNTRRLQELVTSGEIPTLFYCSDCGHCHSHNNRSQCGDSSSILIEGIVVVNDFLDTSETSFLCTQLDTQNTWIHSQSGRRKQDFGPKVNFKRHKVKLGKFSGLPDYSRLIVERFESIKALEAFQPVELCNLEYSRRAGACIEPHIDDVWVWGERLVTVNLNEDTVYTLIKPDLVRRLSDFPDKTLNKKDFVVEIPIPARSLIVLLGESRYDWMHWIQGRHIKERRLGMTFRELSHEFAATEPDRQLLYELDRLSGLFSGMAVGS